MRRRQGAALTDQPLRLAVFGPLPPPESGVETMTQAVLTGLASDVSPRRVRVRHINTRVNRWQSERERFRWRKLGPLGRQLAQSTAAAAARYDAYYPVSQNRIGLLRDLVLLLPFRLLGRHVTIHLHGAALDKALLQQPAWLRRALSFTVPRNRSSGIVLAESNRRCLEPLIDPANIRVVPNSVWIPSTAACEEVVATAQTVRVLFLGTLMPTKGYRELLLAVRELIDEGLDITLDLAGEPLSDSDASWLEPHLSEPRIRYHGHVSGERKWQLMRETNVMAAPPTAPEGQGLTVLEAMATGHALIATAQEGGIAETVGDTGVLLPPVRGRMLVTELKQALRSLADPAARRTLAARAEQRFSLKFSPDAYLGQWLDAVFDTSPR